MSGSVAGIRTFGLEMVALQTYGGVRADGYGKWVSRRDASEQAPEYIGLAEQRSLSEGPRNDRKGTPGDRGLRFKYAGQ